MAFAGLALACNGYVFGQADHAIHLCFLDYQSHPARWEGDLLAATAKHHHSLFWMLQAPLSRLLEPPLWTALGYLSAVLATGAALFHLSMVLWKSRTAALLTLLVLAPAQFALGGVSTLDPLLLNRTAALPLEIFAIAALAAGRAPLSFGLLGLAANLHVPSAAALAAALTAVHMMPIKGLKTPERAPWKRVLTPLLCPLIASPLIAQWLATGGASASSLWVDPVWRSVLDVRMTHHLFAANWAADQWFKMAAWMIAGLALVALRPRDTARDLLLALIAGLCAWAVIAGELIGAQLGLALALQLEPWQAFRFVTILCASGALAGLVHLQRGSLAKPMANGLIVLTVLLAFLLGGPERRSFLPMGEQGEVSELAAAISAKVPQGEKMLVPPVGLESLRWRTLRPQSLNWKDGGESLFSRSFALNWKRAMERSCDCRPFTREPPDSGRGLTGLRKQLREGHANLNASQLQEIARLQGSRYLVARSQLALKGSKLRALHNGPQWTLYSVGAAAAASSGDAAGSEPPANTTPR